MDDNNNINPELTPDEEEEEDLECENCGASIEVGEQIWVNDAAYCDDCAIVCSRCGCGVPNDDATYCDGDYYCRRCAERSGIWFCDRCDEYRNQYHCHEDEDNYTYSGRCRYLGEGEFFLGAEVEVEFEDESDRERASLEIQSRYRELFYDIHDDGSLSDGFEVNLNPMSPDWIRENAGLVENFVTCLRHLNATAWDSGRCGLHVHVDRRAVSTFGLVRMQMLLIQEHLSFWMGITGRKRCTFESGGMAELPYLRNVVQVEGEYGPHKKVALNRCHENTYEIRVWRGNVYEGWLVGILQLTEALVRWGNSPEERYERIMPQSFLLYVCDHKEELTHANALLERRMGYSYRQMVGKIREEVQLKCA